MKKRCMKMLAVLLACCMMITALTACGSSSSDSDEASGDSDSASSDEIVEIVMIFPGFGYAADDEDLVEDAINEIAEEEIGVHVTFLPTTISDVESEVTRMAAAGEQVDIIPVMSVSSYISNGLVAPLNDLLDEYGQDIQDTLGVLLEAYTSDGETYSIFDSTLYAEYMSIYFRTDILEKYGLSLEEGETLTYEIMDEWFEIIHEGEGDGFYMLAPYGSGADSSMINKVTDTDTLGGESYTGVLTDYAGDSDDYTITNIFETDEYAEYLYWMNKWYNAGYLNPDSAALTDTPSDLVAAGNYLGYVSSGGPGNEEYNENNVGMDLTAYNMEEKANITSTNYGAGWCISSSSTNQEAAMKFLNLLFSNQDVANLLEYGIEGVHYVETDEEGVIEYPEGVDSSTVTYTGPIGIHSGNTSTLSYFSPYTTEIIEDLKAWNEDVVACANGENDDYDVSKVLGYVFDQSNVKTEIAAVSDVVTEYLGVILYGSQDPDEMLEDLNEALYAAGLETILEENQSQLDAWLAKQ